MFVTNFIYRILHTKHELIKKYLNKASTILEIGSHLGTDTVIFRKNFPTANIFCFEPDPRSREIFIKYHSNLGVNVIPYAVSNENKEKKFFQSFSKLHEEHTLKKYSWIDSNDVLKNKLSRSGASSLKKGHSALANANVIKIKTIKLDDWAEKNNITNVDLIWMDVQGGEQDVFDGAQKLLKTTRYIWTEYGEIDYEGAMTWNNTKKKLKDNFNLVNYESFFRSRGDMFFENKLIKNT